MITIVDIGLGNILSIFNMLKYIGVEVKVSNTINDISNSSKLILPGVGSYDSAMTNIKKLNIYNVLKQNYKQFI